MPQWFDEVAIERSKDYWIAVGGGKRHVRRPSLIDELRDVMLNRSQRRAR